MIFGNYNILKLPCVNFFSFKGDKVDTNKLKSVLGNLGIELMPDEHLNLLKTLPVNGKSYGCHWDF